MAIRSELSDISKQRFWAKVTRSNSCWEWTAAKNEKGYGVFGVKKETDKAPRISWALTFGPIPKGLFVCHKCDNPGCVNPDHAIELLGNISDAEIGRLLGVSRKTVLRWRRDRNIPSHPCETRFKSGTPYPYWSKEGRLTCPQNEST